ncbi:choice-of-anchor Q domain-containing protein [Massilia sp. CF038]|uniref:choice-of-anchor Q domain-containing protein n=1 Tax=Massilia sp. CF038 TaxID=1881045 RepID=UPI000917D368|nr:choice-of-anchor Q domain-containing protein [Massilia sp. CF038]SHG98676.1 parallel beta-helix repeat (two copies) [Massilia sp. CF038]
MTIFAAHAKQLRLKTLASSVALLVGFGFVQAAQAASALYVSPNGNDSSAGSASAPFKTLARAARSAVAGTTVYVAPGTYAGNLKTTANGTASARIRWVSTTTWGARIVPVSGSTIKVAWDNRGNYVDIIGFQIDGNNSKWTSGIYNGGSYDLIKSNWVHHIAKGVSCTSAGGSAIGVDSYYHGVRSDVIGNLVNDIGPAGCRYVQGIYISTSGTVKNNVVYRVAEGGIHLWHDANNVIITNNTVVASHTGIIVGGGDFYHTAGPADYIQVRSNIVYDNAMGISEQGRTGTHNVYSNNLVARNSTYNWQLKNGLTHSATVSSEPLFVGYTRTGTPDLRLTVSSPAIGRGSPIQAESSDFLGRPRNTSTGFDIGAYQH